jgi:2-keto-4-pentenoate hydratase/2-oxohepta-3-ene-1,7-dioic acid hydratase in catechol pathway
MRLVTFTSPNGEQHVGAMTADNLHVVDFSAGSGDPHLRSMLDLIEGGEPALEAAREALRLARHTWLLSDVRLRAALPRPIQMRDFQCFEQHYRQARANRHLCGAVGTETDPAKVVIPDIWYQEPAYYKCNRMSVVGTEDDIIVPHFCKMMDYELEFAAVIGKTGKNIQREEAGSHIFGFCIFNDFSARDQQMRDMQSLLGPTKGKDFDTGNVLGPWLVTRDELADPYDLTMLARVNGEEWSRGSSSTMYHKFEDLIAHVSREETLYAGELLASGTVGTGCGLEHGQFLKIGDSVELEIEGLGLLRNRLVQS